MGNYPIENPQTAFLRARAVLASKAVQKGSAKPQCCRSMTNAARNVLAAETSLGL